MSTAENKSLTSQTQGETLIKWLLSPGAQPFPVSPSSFSGCLPSPGQEEGLGRKGYTAQDHELSAEGQRTLLVEREQWTLRLTVQLYKLSLKSREDLKCYFSPNF